MDTIDLGDDAAWRPGRRTVLVVALVVVLVGVGTLAWRHRTRPWPDFSTTALQDVYAGMVRGDDINRWAALTAPTGLQLGRPLVLPAACTVLFDTTVFNDNPAGAVDGVQTYYQSIVGDRPVPIALTTWRYPDRVAARRAYDTIRAASSDCAVRGVSVGSEDVRLTAVPDAAPGRDASVLAYTFLLLRTPFAVHVMRYANTISWQFRGVPGNATDYDPGPGDQLLSSLYQQLVAVRSALV